MDLFQGIIQFLQKQVAYFQLKYKLELLNR